MVTSNVDAISLANCDEVAGCFAGNRAEKTHAGEVAVMERGAEDEGRGVPRGATSCAVHAHL